MSTLELKEILKSKIDKIDNEHFLLEINDIFEYKFESIESYNLDLQNSEGDILKGNVFTHNKVLSKIEEWKKR